MENLEIQNGIAWNKSSKWNCLESKLTQEELGKLIGVQMAHISKLENNATITNRFESIIVNVHIEN